MTALLLSRLLRASGSMLQRQTTMVDTLQAESIAITSAFLLLFFVCGVALLQSRLIKAAGRWQQHRASIIQPRNHTLLSRTNTTAAELYYLRHMRSCAAAAMGNKGSDSSPSTALQISGASFIGRVLQSIAQMVLYYAKIAMKLIMMFSALLRDMLIFCTPLELAACFHLVEAYMHRDLYTYHCESDHCRVSAVSAPSAQKIATIALALLILSLSIIDWHVPRCFRSHQLLCRILTAMSMQALRVELACTVIAFLLPTFGKRSQDQGSTSRKRSTPTRPATEQTPEIPADAEATMQDPGNASILRCSDSAVEQDAATEHIAPASFGSAGEASSGCGDMTIKSFDDVVSKLSSDCDESAAALRNAVQTLQRGVQAEIRNLCKPWGVQLTAITTMANLASVLTASSKASLQPHL